MRAVARQVMERLGAAPVRPFESVSLGESKLLRFSVSQAASFFGIDAPASRRDRKSGAKKRKQIEIEQERILAQSSSHAR